MAALTLFAKFVVVLDTPRSEAVIRSNMATLEQTYRDRIADAIAGDPQTTFTSATYRLKVAPRDGGWQVYPKLILTVDTTRTRQQVHQVLDGIFDDLKADIRALVQGDALTTIVSWHRHLSTGANDEDES